MRYVLLFRGLNVGGNSKVKMAELADMLRGLGLGGVVTYIQSGNAAVDTALAADALARQVADAFAARFGFAAGVVAFDAEELQGIVAGLPFTVAEIAAAEALNPETEHLYVYLLPQKPSPEALAALAAAQEGGDRLHAAGRAMYALFADSVRTSKAARRIAKHLPDATARNWRTTLALLALAEGKTP